MSAGSSKESSGNVSALMKRGKRNIAKFFKGEVKGKFGENESLNNLLNSLLDPRVKPIDDVDVIDWCRSLIAGGATFDEFAKIVKQYDNAVTCGLVWTANFVAYRCRTCGISPCMSLCADCFQAGQHEGHDYNMFRSQAGGACDCGDISVMKPSGFCSRHGPDRQNACTSPPENLLCIAETMIPRVILRLIHHLRDNSKEDVKGTYHLSMQDEEQFLNFLHSLSDMGAAMRRVMGAALTNEEVYKSMTHVELKEDGSNAYFVESQAAYQKTVDNLEFPPVFDERLNTAFPDSTKKPPSQKLQHKTLLDELVFWMVKYEFPQKIVTLLLSLLPDDDYKEAFTRAFIAHYSRITLVLVNGLHRSAIANRVVHISVQLFSNSQLAEKMNQEYNFLYTLIASLSSMVETVITQSTLQGSDNNLHMVVDCDHEAMKEHCYWPVVSDLINLLSHQPIAHDFLSDDELLNKWLELLSYFQGMNVNQRELNQHMGYEPETYYAAFSAELEIASSPMWSLIAHCKNKDTKTLTCNMIYQCLFMLKDWFEAVGIIPSSKVSPYQVTFHLPLHRYLATFLAQGIHHQDLRLSEISFSDIQNQILVHPQRIQVSIAEIYANMWVRNGLQIRGQAMTYVQCHFCFSMIDADIYLQQVCACKMDPDEFIQTVLERFHIKDWLSYASKEDHEPEFKFEPEQEIAMVDAALSYLVTLLGIKTYLGVEEKDLIRQEMASVLCVTDRQHSQIMDLMPEKSGITGYGKDLYEPTLKELADYKAPLFEVGGGLQQGTYIPKDVVWDKYFDPVHLGLRAVYRKDFQSAMDRYSAFVKQHRNYTSKSPPWPPFRIADGIHPEYKDLFRILHCRSLHAFLFTVIQRCLSANNLPDSTLYYAVHLFNLALTVPNPEQSTKTRNFNGCVPDQNYKEWFSSNSILRNACDVIKEVHVPAPYVEMESSITVSASPTDIHSSSVDEMFSLAPSAVRSSCGPISSVHRGNKQTHSSPVVPIHSVVNKTEPKSYESRGVSTEVIKPIPVPVGESLLSLLVKQHNKLSGKGGSYVPLSMCTRQAAVGSVGDGIHFITCLLDKISQLNPDCAKCVEEIFKKLSPPPQERKKSDAQIREEKKRKARERQQKLMAEMASKQKEFLQQNSFTEDFKEDDWKQEEGEASEMQIPPDKEFQCVICGHSEPSTPEKPIGLVVLLQASSVLGHRLQTEDPVRLAVDGEKTPKPVNCAIIQRKKLETLFGHFEESSCQMSVNIGWEGGVVTQTCGHYLHLDCHSSYVNSLKTQEVNQNLLVNKGEYWCPLCRQLSNSVIPILPEESKYTLVKPLSPNPLQMVQDMAEMMIKRPITPNSSSLTKAMGGVMEDLTNATYGVFKTYTSSQTSESVLLFVCSVARSNLEMELLQRGGELSAETSVGRKHCFGPLTDVLSMHSKILTTRPYTDLWSHITGISCSQKSSSVTVYQNEVPLLLKDPVSLLIQLVLTLPSTIEKEHYSFLVKMLYNVVLIQALACTSCKFTVDEREAWRKKGRMVEFGTLEGMLSHVITRLEVSRLYEDVDTASKEVLAICQSVWSPHCVDMAVQDFCLPFLRMAALVKYHIFGQEFTPKVADWTEFQQLCSYLDMLPSGPSENTINSVSVALWIVEEPLVLVRAWCTALTNFINSYPAEAKSLLLVNPTWFSPQLLSLPHHYYKIFQAYSNVSCTSCSHVPKDPAICLICGTFLCFRQHCCQQQGVYECVRHSIECGAGTCMFLLVNSSVVVVIRGSRATLWGSVYLDDHGEEDRDLKRGKPLYLSQERFSLLQHQWLSHTFDHSCKRWIWHSDRL